jgi:hypothetical protein
MSDTDKFTIWLGKGRNSEPGDAPRKLNLNPVNEPAEAADAAESWLSTLGIPGESYAEIRFNGDAEPHTIIFLMEETDATGGQPVYGVFNTPSALWPVYYPQDNPFGMVLDGLPDGYPKPPESETEDVEDAEHDEDEDADSMDLGADSSDDENDEDEGEDDEEPEESEDEPDESEDSEGDETEDEISDESEDEGEVEDDESDNETEQEKEMPRLKIFGKMKGPKGWRKRAEIEDLNERNVFGFKVGALIEDEELSAAKQEANVFVTAEFIETDADREAGLLRLKLPDGITLNDFTQTKSGVITARVPYPRES